MLSLSRPVHASVCALLLIVGSGCHEGISWLPDSSGFVYVEGKSSKQLLLFDVKTKTSKVLVKDVGDPAWPAVSPDGKRIALAHRKVEGKRCWLIVTVYDREGRAVHVSKPLLEKPIISERTALPEASPLVGWSPRGDRLLLGLDDRTGLYDSKAEKLDDVPGALVRIGTDLVRPDGKGFLTVTKGGYAFVNWARKALQIKSDDELDRFSLSSRQKAMLASPSHWDGRVAVVNVDANACERIDTAKLAIDFEQSDSTQTFRVAKDVTLELVSGSSLRVRHKGGTRTLFSHKKWVRASHSPDGKWLAVGYQQSTDLLDLKETMKSRLILLNQQGEVVARLPSMPDEVIPQLVARLSVPKQRLSLLAFSRDGKSLTAAGKDGSYRRWDLTAKQVGAPTLSRSLEDANCNLVALSADGSTFAAVSRFTVKSAIEDTIYVWDVTTGKLMATLDDEENPVTAIALSPDSKTLAVGRKSAIVQLWDLKTKKVRRKLEAQKLGASVLAFSADGKTLRAAGEAEDHLEYRSWDVQKAGKPVIVRCDGKATEGLALDLAGKVMAGWGEDRLAYLVSGRLFEIRLWDLATAKHSETLRGLAGQLGHAVFSPDGRLLASGTSDGTVRLWDVRSGKTVASYCEFSAGVQRLAFSPDGKLLAGAAGEEIEVWRVPAAEK